MTAPASMVETLQLAAHLHRQGDLAGARALYGQVIAREPHHAEALHLAGAAAAQAGQAQEAEPLLRRAARLQPANAYIQMNLAATLQATGKLAAAIPVIARAVTLAPALPVVHQQQGDLFEALGRFEAALASFRRAAVLAPHDPGPIIKQGNVLAMLDRMEDAVRAFEAALHLAPGNALAHKQLGTALMLLGRYPDALSNFDRTLELAPGLADAHYNRALVLLTQGDYEQGLAEYEWRWRAPSTYSSRARRNLEEPQWRGGDELAGRRILLYHEQGLGDTLQFCRYASLVAQRGATVLLQVQRPLVPLLRRLDGVTEIFAHDEPVPPFDLHCPLMSLPFAFGTRLATIPAPSGYLAADPQRVADWQQRLGPRTAPRIGLMWNGNPDNPDDSHRSFTLAEWLEHLPKGFDYVSLQRFVQPKDRAALSRGVVRNTAAQQRDFEDAAALCACMDLTISVCTSIAHLSGALGRPTWVLLAKRADWRWLLDRSDSPWYPQSRLYRQSTAGEWPEVFSRVSAALRRELGQATTLQP